jgi:hypothetical protein
MSRFDSEKTPQRSRWSLETSKPIDAAIALLIVVPVLHLLGLDADVVRWLASAL